VGIAEESGTLLVEAGDGTLGGYDMMGPQSDDTWIVLIVSELFIFGQKTSKGVHRNSLAMHINLCAETSRTLSLTFLVLLPHCSSALPIVLKMYLLFYGELSVVWSDEIELGQYMRVWSTIFSSSDGV
jgi:hypothetical protein